MPRKPLITSIETFNEIGIRKVNSKKLEKYISNTYKEVFDTCGLY